MTIRHDLLTPVTMESLIVNEDFISTNLVIVSQCLTPHEAFFVGGFMSIRLKLLV